jgi:DNA-binding response OmpR family regulator
VATILVVDDEPDIRSVIKLNLELDGHVVRTAADGAEALAQVADIVPDLMLLDLVMPELDGWGVLEAIKSATDLEINRIPVLMLTASDTPDNRIRGGIEGAIRYLTKPFSPTGLREEVAAALDGDDEPVQRRRAQHRALEDLARREKPSPPLPPSTVRPRLTRLENRGPRPVGPGREEPPARQLLPSLTPKQRALLEHLATAPSVSDAAVQLGVSRSNIYASLRRIGRKLDVASASELLALVRGGLLDDSA